MSRLRRECVTSSDQALSDETVLYLVRDSVARRKALIYGRLDDDKGHHCAMGAFWADNPNVTVNTRLLDEVATVNDSLPPTASPQERWKKVNSWIRWKIRIMTPPRGRTAI